MDRRQLAVFSSLTNATIRSTLLFCGIAVSLVHAQIEQVQRQESLTDTPRYAIRGTVVNSVTGTPIARAIVELNFQYTRYTMTDSNGAFRFEGVPEGLVTLRAERPGFFKPNELSSTRKSSTASIQSRAQVDSIVLTLVPESDIAGRVLSIEGLPIQGFPVRLYKRNIVDGAIHWDKAASVYCSEDGYFRIFGVTEGSFIVSAGPEPWRPRPSGVKHIGYPLVFYPNVHEFAAASVLSITTGEHVEADFSLSPEPLFEVSGQVIGVPGSIDTKVELSSSSGDPLPMEQPHPERHEFFGYVPGGRHTLRASAEVEGRVWQATVPLNIASNTSGIPITLGMRLPLTVNVETEFGFGHTESAVPSGATVRLVSTAASLNPIEFAAKQVGIRNTSAMEIDGPEPGNYSVEINPFGAYVKAATSGSIDLLQEDLVVPEGGRLASIEILLSKGGGQVAGSVKLRDHESGATVLLVPERGSTKTIRTVVTEETGEFQFEQVRPGDYFLFAFDRIDDLEYRNVDVLRNYQSSAIHVSVLPTQLVRVSLELIHLVE